MYGKTIVIKNPNFFTAFMNKDDPSATKEIVVCPMATGGFPQESYTQEGKAFRSTFFGDTGALPAKLFMLPGELKCNRCNRAGTYVETRFISNAKQSSKIDKVLKNERQCDIYDEWKKKKDESLKVRRARFED